MHSWRHAQERTVLGYIDQLPHMPDRRFRAVAAIPVRDEAERIGDCLDALIDQRARNGAALPPGTFGLLLLTNNCTDETVGIARARLVGTLERHDVAIRHDLRPAQGPRRGWGRRCAADALVDTRHAGRRPAGAVAQNALRRFVWRARLRHWHGLGARGWIATLALPASAMEWAGPHFGAFWQKVEAASPVLARHALRPSQLPANTRAARRIIDALEQAALSRGSGSRACIRAPAPVEPCELDVAQAGS